VCKVWEEESIPEEWKRSIKCPVNKKRDELLCNNYRDISLLSTSYKILTRILKRRLEPFLKRILEHQAGFQPGTSNTDNLFTLRQMTEKCREYKVDIYIFVDFKQAYDCIL
jgi:hypothetical protein